MLRFAPDNHTQLAHSVRAEAHRIPGVSVTLYEHSGFDGIRKKFSDDQSSLPGFNDKATGVVVR